jgi:hypothetical protein
MCACFVRALSFDAGLPSPHRICMGFRMLQPMPSLPVTIG